MDTDIVWFVVIGLAAGWLAGFLLKGGGFGLLGDLVVGVLGSVIGGWLLSRVGVFPGSGLVASLVTATVGAIILILGLRVLKRIQNELG